MYFYNKRQISPYTDINHASHSFKKRQLCYKMFSIKYYCTCKARRFVGKSRLLCGCSISRQCNIFIDCKPHGRISHTVCKLTTPLQISSANVGLLKEHLNCGFKSHQNQLDDILNQVDFEQNFNLIVDSYVSHDYIWL